MGKSVSVKPEHLHLQARQLCLKALTRSLDQKLTPSSHEPVGVALAYSDSRKERELEEVLLFHCQDWLVSSLPG
jgi:hypothetical protein